MLASLIRIPGRTVEGLAREILQAVLVPAHLPFVPLDGYQSVIDSELCLGDPPEPLAPDLRKCLDDLVAALRGEARHTVFLKGPNYSGKKSVIRAFVAECLNDKRRFVVDPLTELPVLALSLSDLTPWEFIDRVFQFFVGDNPTIDPSATTYGVLERIRWMAGRSPACVLFAGIGPIDQNEIVRALYQDQIGEVVSAILEGDQRSRLVLSTTTDNPLTLARRKAAVISGSLATVSTPDRGSIGLVTRLGSVARNVVAAAALPKASRDDLLDRLRGRVEREQPEEIILLLLESVLGEDDRIIIGLIASSEDGLERTTLNAIVAAMRLAPQPLSLPDPLETVLSRLAGLIHRRRVEVDPRRRIGRRRDELYYVNKGWRALVLRWWMNNRTSLARLGFWMIAREAAVQSRAIRISATHLGTAAAIGRDLHGLTALVASIDIAKATSASIREEPESDFPEWIILPPLEITATFPSPSLAYRYAFRVLYEDDLEGGNQRLLARYDDARLRLRALIPFFSPASPWESVDDWILDKDSGASVPLALLRPDEVLTLLESTGIAAARLQKNQVVSAAARIAERLLADPDVVVDALPVMRILRSELDSGIFIGGNPDRPHDPGGIAAVVARMERLLEEVFAPHSTAPNAEVARGKLLARYAEALHLSGQPERALETFRAIEAMEAQLREQPGGPEQAPVLGGRGARSYLRLALDVGRRELWSLTNDAPFVVYQDGFAQPFSPMLGPTDDWFGLAKKLESLNARRLAKARSADWIGAKIDAARLAAAGHRFTDALTFLDEALAFRFTPGSSIESLLELLSVRTRQLVDAAALAIACWDMPAARIAAYTQEIEHLARYVRVELDPHLDRGSAPGRFDTRELSGRLIARARDSLDALRRFLKPDQIQAQPHRMFADYLEVWLDVIDTRQTDPGHDASSRAQRVAELLRNAAEKLNVVLAQMRRIGFGMHMREGELLAHGLAAAEQLRLQSQLQSTTSEHGTE